MSEPEKINLKTIAKDAIVSIEVSGHFHKRLVAAYLNFSGQIEPERFKTICQHMSNGTIAKLDNEQDQSNAAAFYTMLSLINALEEAFNDKGLVNEESVELPTEDSTS